MAKIPFSKLGIKINTDISYVTIGEYQIEVKQYLPMEEKAALVANIMNFSVDDTGFYNPLRVKTFLTLEIMYTYTNLGFTAKMKEEGLKLYDTVISSGLFDKIIEAIPTSEWEELQNSVWQTIQNVYDYKNSAMGILEGIATDYSDLNLDADALASKVLNPESLATLKELMPLAQ